jgi:two-component system LytT family sensor kinase
MSLLFATAGTISSAELAAGAIRVTSGVCVAYLVYRMIRRTPSRWPSRTRFVAFHVVAAPLAALLWFAISSPLESALWASDASDRPLEFLFLGVFFYAIVAGIAHAAEASARAARAEAIAAQTQLGALRAQLHPHFLFNALHTVVQLIPIEPARAAEAAELVADLLRTTLEEQRDELSLDEEWRFVARYLAIERIRFGERLIVRTDLDERLLDQRVPAFALQTLVENAVHHGAAPRVAPTEIVITAETTESELRLSVRNSGDVGQTRVAQNGVGTGLARLRERLAVLYGAAGQLRCGAAVDGGYEAVLIVPRRSI